MLGVQIFELIISDSCKATRYSPAAIDCNATKQDWTHNSVAFEVEAHAGRDGAQRNGSLNIQERTNGVGIEPATPD